MEGTAVRKCGCMGVAARHHRHRCSGALQEAPELSETAESSPSINKCKCRSVPGRAGATLGGGRAAPASDSRRHAVPAAAQQWEALPSLRTPARSCGHGSFKHASCSQRCCCWRAAARRRPRGPRAAPACCRLALAGGPTRSRSTGPPPGEAAAAAATAAAARVCAPPRPLPPGSVSPQCRGAAHTTTAFCRYRLAGMQPDSGYEVRVSLPGTVSA